jgi:hypothetical protein
MRRVQLALAIGLAACGPSSGRDGVDGIDGEDGAPGAPGAPGASGTTGQEILEAVGDGQLQVSAATNYTVIPGLTITANVPANAKLHIDTNGGIQCTGVGTAYAVVDLAIFVDGSITFAQRRVVAANTDGLAQMIQSWSFGRSFTLTPGTHTIDVRVQGVDPQAAIANVSSASAPQLQGVLTVATLKL